ncbi:unnamed protein product [Amoebophrya sp. A120]|nr:unnamed protein product [Amoebophrya sp. A120]|eukprot:GSA120T00019049001.1
MACSDGTINRNGNGDKNSKPRPTPVLHRRVKKDQDVSGWKTCCDATLVPDESY